ncbi:YIEGIA family protein [Cohnella sp. GCM10020058]|uniref:YIEGIA family protein n=1 Tax=Cohnella sp. GCM10020058 TaxID=3317330 RepID=UPI003633B3D1
MITAKWLAGHHELIGVTLGTLFGFLARVVMLRSDYRQYPAYPHGKIIHLALGLIAGALGAVAVPALMSKDYTAITFLSLAAQQFREVRNMERGTLTAIDHQELVPRGATYIEGIAVVFEGRNYLSIATALIVSFAATIIGWIWGVLLGIVCIVIVLRFMKGKTIKDIAEVSFATVTAENASVTVGPVYMMNVGLESDLEIIRKQALGFMLTPVSDDAKVTLSNLGLRQAILHDLSTRLGVYRDDGEPALLPIAKLDLETGALGVLLLPREHGMEKALKAMRDVPLLESAVRRPTKANKTKGEPAHG